MFNIQPRLPDILTLIVILKEIDLIIYKGTAIWTISGIHIYIV